MKVATKYNIGHRFSSPDKREEIEIRIITIRVEECLSESGKKKKDIDIGYSVDYFENGKLTSKRKYWQSELRRYFPLKIKPKK